MTVNELIEKLKAFPGDIPVNIYDWKKNMGDDIGDGSSAGIYPDFEVSEMNLSDDEKEFIKESQDRDFKPWVAISFENSDYDDDGQLME